MAQPYTRPQEGFRFQFGGLKTNAVPDAVGPTKYPLAVNVRGTLDNAVVTRPGQTQQFLAGADPITDFRAYSPINTNDRPRILARDAAGSVWLDTGVAAFTSGNPALVNSGASLIPFRPAQSPNPYMYIADATTSYQKFSPPSALGAVTVSNVGIAEPQTPPATGPGSYIFGTVSTPTVNGGTAGGETPGDRTGPAVLINVFPWPAPATRQFSLVGPGGADNIGRFQVLDIGPNPAIVTDLFPGSTGFLNVSGVFYYAGNTGLCVVVPANLGSGPGSGGESVFTEAFIANLRRGAVIQLGNGTDDELCMVLDVTEGPDGTVCFETSTVNAHTGPNQVINFIPSFTVSMLSPTTPTVGQNVVDSDITFTVTAGIGTMSGTTTSPFQPGSAFQDADYVHFAINVDLLANLNEIKLLFDVGDGTFTQNFYYYTLRPSDLTAGVTNALTQLGVAQIVTQRATIDEELAASANNAGTTASSEQISPGDAQWSDIIFNIAALTRVGNDQSATLQNINAVQVLVNANATVVVKVGDINIFGGGQPDVGDVGQPYLYRIRPRSTVTGAVGNPSPATRYGLSLRRQPGLVALPLTAYDPQFDTWDVFRFGGSVTSWRFIGSQTVGTSPFMDNYGDDAAQGGDPLDFDNFEPWPTVAPPFNSLAVAVNGTVAIVSALNANENPLDFLPGNLVRLGGQNVYTLYTRPIPFAAPNFYLFQFVENAGFALGVPVQIYEPAQARALAPYMWGPDASGTVFAAGDPLRPGTFYFSKPYAPDSAPDTYNQELVQPSEPLLGGEVLDGLSFVASSERWWALYFQPDNEAQRYNAVQMTWPRGLAAPFAHCNDGVSIYWWAKDGIYSSTDGNLTDADLHNLFPYEGIPGADYVYNGRTVHAPNYANVGSFRLTFGNGFLYATYTDSSGLYRTLTYDIRRKAWIVDQYSPTASAFYHVEQEAAQAPGSAPAYPSLLMASIPAAATSSKASVSTQTPNANDVAGTIECTLATWEFDGGDARSAEQWGDLYLDATPAAQGAALRLQPMSLGQPVVTATAFAPSATRQQTPVSLLGGALLNFLGIFLTWTDDFSVQGPNPTQLYVWQPSFIPKPETIDDRATDWDDAGSLAAKFWQGFVIHLDTFNNVKGLSVVDSDTGATHLFTPAVQQNGEGELAFSFVTPFIAHMVKIVPTDQVPWRFFGVRWVTQPTPETAETWTTQNSVFGLKGYMHLRQVSLCYASTQDVTFVATSYDGMSPVVLTFPATAGAVVKTVLPFSANKGQLWRFDVTSPEPFQLFQSQSELLVGAWGRGDDYHNVPLVGDLGGDQAKI